MANNKKASESLKDTILGWMKKKSPDVVPTPSSEKGGRGWTPKATNSMGDAAALSASSRENYKKGNYEAFRDDVSNSEGARMNANMANESHRRKMLDEAKGKTTSTGMGRKLKAESDDFYNSDAGKNTSDYVTMKGDIAKNPDKKKGSGFGVRIDDGSKTMTPKQLSDFISQHAAGNYGAKLNDFNDGLRVNKPSKPQKMWEEHPNQREHHTNMAKRGLAENIGKHVPNRDEYIKMQGKVPFSKANIVTHKGGLTDVDKVALGGMGGALGGEIISAGIDLEAAKKRRDSEVEKNQSSGVKSQADAHSYWSRKKSGQ